MCNIIRPEMVFYNKYKLIMYSKTTFTKVEKEYISLEENFLRDKILKVEKGLNVSDL